MSRKAQCSYEPERRAVLYAVSRFVGEIWLTARWATTGKGGRPIPFEVIERDLQIVTNMFAAELAVHQREWHNLPIHVWYPGTPAPVFFPCATLTPTNTDPR